MSAQPRVTRCTFFDTKSVAREPRIFDLAESACREGRKLVIYASSDDRADELDRFLWVYRQESFVPHRRFAYAEDDAPEPVAIVTAAINPIGADAIVADGACPFDFAATFSHVYEFVDNSTAASLTESRSRFKTYKERGFDMEYDKE